MKETKESQEALAKLGLTESSVQQPFTGSIQEILYTVVNHFQDNPTAIIRSNFSGLNVSEQENSIIINLGTSNTKIEPIEQVISKKSEKIRQIIAQIETYKEKNSDIISKVGDIDQNARVEAHQLAEYIIAAKKFKAQLADQNAIFNQIIEDELVGPLQELSKQEKVKVSIKHGLPCLESIDNSVQGLGGFNIKLIPENNGELNRIKTKYLTLKIIYLHYKGTYINRETVMKDSSGNTFIAVNRYSIGSESEKGGYCVTESPFADYAGWLKNGLRHGEGDFFIKNEGKRLKGRFEKGLLVSGEISALNWKQRGIFKDESLIEGTWEFPLCTLSGKFNGRDFAGTYIEGAQRIEGSFKNFKPHGKCLIYLNSKLCYDGWCTNGEVEGQGARYLDDGTVLLGEFVNDALHGQGTLFNNDYTMEGKFENGKLIQGKIIAGNFKYEGFFLNGQLNGACKVYRNNTLIFDGNFKMGKTDGFAKEFGQDESYEGYWKDGLKHGRGIYVAYDVVYEGEFEYGSIMQGKMSEGSQCYEGSFSNFQPNGGGKLYKNNVLIYEGNFLNGVYSGQGRMIDGNIVRQGTFESNDFVNGQIFENGQLAYEGPASNGWLSGYGKRYENGRIQYEGDFLNGQPHGNGTLYENGIPHRVTFINGARTS